MESGDFRWRFHFRHAARTTEPSFVGAASLETKSRLAVRLDQATGRNAREPPPTVCGGSRICDYRPAAEDSICFWIFSRLKEPGV